MLERDFQVSDNLKQIKNILFHFMVKLILSKQILTELEKLLAAALVVESIQIQMQGKA